VSKEEPIMLDGEAIQERRSDYDVTNRVQVSSPDRVRRAVQELFKGLYPRQSFDPVWLAFHDFERLFKGLEPEYHPVDTSYHDIQHTLDVTLATARLVAGYEKSVESGVRLGGERAKFAIVSALFHDMGYLRHREHDAATENGAEFTRSHVTRSGRFLEGYLPKVGLDTFVPVASRVLHFTGYEMSIEQIELDDPRDSIVGHLLGTGDLLAQLADRCYLEKCRDRLYPEFVLGDVAVEMKPEGSHSLYRSGRDLLAKTMDFYHSSAQHRLEHSFNRAYRYVEALYEDAENPYMTFINRNISFLTRVKAEEDWDKLRRHAPCVMPDPDGEARLMTLALRKLREISESEREHSRRTRTLRLA
jgi:hypothetical protein